MEKTVPAGVEFLQKGYEKFEDDDYAGDLTAF